MQSIINTMRLVNTADQNASILKLYFSVLGYIFREPTAYADHLNKATNERVEHKAMFAYLRAAGDFLQENLDLEKYYFNVAFDNKNIKIKQLKV
jgi:ribonucleotide reductase beta subunit family protein with ferritin-like domain